MPDIHWGYGFPIGGVAAFDIEEGVISPGGVGYDINCGVRLAVSNLPVTDVRSRLKTLVDTLHRTIPTGVGSTGSVKLSVKEEKNVLKSGAGWSLREGYGEASDLERTEDGGRMPEADPDAVSDRALERGRKQLGTLGSGNHFLEVGCVDTVYEPETAAAFGISEGQVTLLLHTGSRGFGHQVCDDALAEMMKTAKKYPFQPPDRQLVSVPINSPEGRRYYAAMACAANFAWANRQILLQKTRDAFYHVFQAGPREVNLRQVYDVCHNIAKRESHTLNGKTQELCVHRKGATRAFGPGRPELPDIYRTTGQPVIVPGDMGTFSYVLVGTQTAMDTTFGSTCHGAGRVLSRSAAKKAAKGRAIGRELEDAGILVRWTGKSTLVEEMPDAYKDISRVVDIVHRAGVSRKVARLKPLAVVKG
jgi:tRNA-splicing ligase RtcB